MGLKLITTTSCVIGFGIICATTLSDISNGQDTVYSAEYLLSMGESLNSPLLKLMGLAILCNQPHCSEWSDWTRCCIKPGSRFGTWNHTRVCGGDKDVRCRSTTERKEEIELGLCEGFCPCHYKLTQHGFCLKFTPEKVNHAVASARCVQDGGYLVNINSDQKLEDIKNTFNPNGVFVVDGTKTSSTSPWEYTHGGVPSDMNWGRGEPNNVPDELCMGYSSQWIRFDGICSGARYFMCEIVNP